jgi:cytochrome d ubiquinol oxidase subunit I
VQTLSVPGALSLMAGYSADTEVRGLRDFPADQRPPVLPVFLSFRLMVGLGILFLAVSLYAFLKRHSIEDQPGFLKLLPWLIPLPYLANQLGWTLSELGRQPWIVYGIMRTRDAVSPIATLQVATSLVAFFLVYALLGGADFYLLFTFARKGPDSLNAR